MRVVVLRASLKRQELNKIPVDMKIVSEIVAKLRSLYGEAQSILSHSAWADFCDLRQSTDPSLDVAGYISLWNSRYADVLSSRSQYVLSEPVHFIIFVNSLESTWRDIALDPNKVTRDNLNECFERLKDAGRAREVRGVMEVGCSGLKSVEMWQTEATIRDFLPDLVFVHQAHFIKTFHLVHFPVHSSCHLLEPIWPKQKQSITSVGKSDATFHKIQLGYECDAKARDVKTSTEIRLINLGTADVIKQRADSSSVCRRRSWKRSGEPDMGTVAAESTKVEMDMVSTPVKGGTGGVNRGLESFPKEKEEGEEAAATLAATSTGRRLFTTQAG
ncbi:hypothetical protein BT69DRAFT_1299903 [Atractiella rhizophila]|nr:hypothetical protein BT69DRAFT_1299903 [Atractiella rhizophila]